MYRVYARVWMIRSASREYGVRISAGFRFFRRSAWSVRDAWEDSRASRSRVYRWIAGLRRSSRCSPCRTIHIVNSLEGGGIKADDPFVHLSPVGHKGLAELDNMPAHGLYHLRFCGTGCEIDFGVQPVDLEEIPVRLPVGRAGTGYPIVPKLLVPWTARIGKVTSGSFGIFSGMNLTSSIFHAIQWTNPPPPGASGSVQMMARHFERPTFTPPTSISGDLSSPSQVYALGRSLTEIRMLNDSICSSHPCMHHERRDS